MKPAQAIPRIGRNNLLPVEVEELKVLFSKRHQYSTYRVVVRARLHNLRVKYPKGG